MRDDMFNGIFTGVIISSMLWGGACVQTFQYFTKFKKDKMFYRTAVAFAFALQTAYIGLSITDLNRHVMHLEEPGHISTLTRSLPAQIIVQQVATTIAQSVFAHRVYCVYERNVVIAVPLFLAILVQLVTSIAYACQVTTVKSYAGLSSLVVIPIVFGAFNTTAGALITGLITSILRHHRVHAQQRHIDPLSPVQNKVYAHYALNVLLTTGLLPTLFTLAFFACFASFTRSGHSGMFSCMFAIAGLSWFNTLMASFNSRAAPTQFLSPSNSPITPTTPYLRGRNSPPTSSKNLTIDTNVDSCMEKGYNAQAIVPTLSKAGYRPDGTAHVENPAVSTFGQEYANISPSSPIAKDLSLTRRLSRALSRTFRRSASDEAPKRPVHRIRRPSAACPLSPSERRELGPPLSPPPGQPLPPLPLPLSAPVTQSVEAPIPASESIPIYSVSLGEERLLEQVPPPLVTIVPKQYKESIASAPTLLQAAMGGLGNAAQTKTPNVLRQTNEVTIPLASRTEASSNALRLKRLPPLVVDVSEQPRLLPQPQHQVKKSVRSLPRVPAPTS